jgi:pSer/pThr/pTyr-binding forkhead associated (FHA) protein
MSAELAGGVIMIGRGADCQLILDDDYVSTRHARVVSGVNGIYVEDLGSTNGTYVNGQRITAPTTITMSDTVRIGKTILKLEP